MYGIRMRSLMRGYKPVEKKKSKNLSKKIRKDKVINIYEKN